MTGVYLAPRLTPVSMASVYNSLRRADRSLCPNALLVALSQVDLESASGSAVRNFSLAGVKTRPGGEHDHTFYGTHEIENGRRVDYPAPPLWRQPLITAENAASAELQTCFRAFADLDAATSHHLRFIRESYPDAWTHLVAGLSYEYGLALGDDVGRRYYSADPRAYARGLSLRFEAFRKAMPKWSADV